MTAIRRQAGEIVFLPPSARDLDSTGHPAMLLADAENDAPAIMAYGSTKDTEAKCGAACIRVEPPALADGWGLTEPTFFYPSIIKTARAVDLPQPRHTLPGALSDIRRMIPAALGFETGAGSTCSIVSGSVRGRLVEITERLARHIGTKHAAILSEHRYSARLRYLAVVPLYGSQLPEQIAATVLEGDVALTNALGATSHIFAATGMPVGVRGRSMRECEIVRVMDEELSESSLTSIETGLRLALGAW